jgi:hypothetical protein
MIDLAIQIIFLKQKQKKKTYLSYHIVKVARHASVSVLYLIESNVLRSIRSLVTPLVPKNVPFD